MSKYPDIIIRDKGIRRLDENHLAKMLCDREGKRESLTIAQASEATRILLDILAEMAERDFLGVAGTLDHHRSGNRPQLKLTEGS